MVPTVSSNSLPFIPNKGVPLYKNCGGGLFFQAVNGKRIWDHDQLAGELRVRMIYFDQNSVEGRLPFVSDTRLTSRLKINRVVVSIFGVLQKKKKRSRSQVNVPSPVEASTALAH